MKLGLPRMAVEFTCTLISAAKRELIDIEIRIKKTEIRFIRKHPLNFATMNLI